LRFCVLRFAFAFAWWRRWRYVALHCVGLCFRWCCVALPCAALRCFAFTFAFAFHVSHLCLNWGFAGIISFGLCIGIVCFNTETCGHASHNHINNFTRLWK
jgi:hypothetical protein